MSDSLESVYFRNALRLLAQERRRDNRINQVYIRLRQHNVTAAVEDWLSNPFVSTALLILEKLSGNYRIQQAIKLLREAGAEHTKGKKGKK